MKKGSHHTQEAREKMRYSQTGKKQSQETIEKRVVHLRNKSLSFEHRKKIGDANKIPQKNKWKDEDYRKKMSNAHKGKKFSDATKNKMSLSHIGKNTWTKGVKLSLERRLRMTGKNSHRWKGGTTPINKALRNSSEYYSWRDKVYRRDYWTCQICGNGHDHNIRANHIKKFIDYPELRHDLSNGITICKECDLRLVMRHEEEWENYFNFNLMTRGFIPDLKGGEF